MSQCGRFESAWSLYRAIMGFILLWAVIGSFSTEELSENNGRGYLTMSEKKRGKIKYIFSYVEYKETWQGNDK